MPHMLQSKLFAKIKREPPKDAQVISHKYLTRGDFLEQSINGVYRFLPLGFLVLKKIEKIIREEMLKLDAEELYLPALQNKNLWLETGRWQTIDPPLFKLKDRHQKETALGPTHEEEITDTVRRRIKSYQDLPLYLFQIQDKFRNEMRSSGGLLRTREFLMKDLYSFHADEKDLKRFYEKVKKTYFKIFQRCGLKPLCVEADPGTIGGDFSHEFMVLSPAGEDKVKGQAAIEVGHIFALGTKYSQALKANFINKDGKHQLLEMGCYGIGLPRLMAAVVEIHHDEKGIIWPEELAPFQAHLIPVEISNPKVKKISNQIYQDGQKKGLEVLYDDRTNKTIGEKFAEADLIGIPIRLVVSERTLKQNSVEIKKRDEQKTKLVKLSRIKLYV